MRRGGWRRRAAGGRDVRRGAASSAGGRPVIGFTGFQLSLLFSSHRWIAPAVLFALGVFGLGGAVLPRGAALGQGLAWSALILVSVEAWLTRSMLTAQPAAAPACVAPAGRAPRKHVAAPVAAPAARAAIWP